MDLATVTGIRKDKSNRVKDRSKDSTKSMGKEKEWTCSVKQLALLLMSQLHRKGTTKDSFSQRNSKGRPGVETSSMTVLCSGATAYSAPELINTEHTAAYAAYIITPGV